jgi:sugar transferase EpsL
MRTVGSELAPETTVRNPIAKRALDLLLGATMLMLSLPVLAVAAAAIRMSMGSPILFRQRRAGLHNRPFTALKLRTMSGEAVKGREGTDDAARLTKLGSFLRRTSIDELPQLINVLAGDMSLVGPRPLFLEYFPLYSPEQRRRTDVKPGITGLAQVKGRNALSWEEKLALDVWYVDNQSVNLDLKILVATVGSVLTGRGVTARDQVTARRFEGSAAAAEKR